jgi:parvulin-like peptidyl-prolyl isomerase
MKKLKVLLVIIVSILIACSKQDEVVKLTADSPEYQLAKDLSQIVPALDPDSNKIMINTSSFKVSTGEVIQTLQRNFSNRVEQLKKMQPQRLERIIKENAKGIAEKKLILTAARDEGIAITQEEVDSVLNAQYNRVGGKEKYLELLTRNNITLEFVTEDTRNGLMIQHYFEDVISTEIEVTDEDIQNEYEKKYTGDSKATVRHILLNTRGKSEADKNNIRKKMESILARAKAGEDFATLVKQYSEDPGSKDKGGIYKDFSKGDMVKPFEDAAFSVPIGEVSDIVETQYGFHILKIVDRKKNTQTLEELREEIKNKLREPKKQQVYQTHLEKLKETAEFEVLEL